MSGEELRSATEADAMEELGLLAWCKWLPQMSQDPLPRGGTIKEGQSPLTSINTNLSTHFPRGQSHGSIIFNVVPSSQVILACVKLTKKKITRHSQAE